MKNPWKALKFPRRNTYRGDTYRLMHAKIDVCDAVGAEGECPLCAGVIPENAIVSHYGCCPKSVLCWSCFYKIGWGDVTVPDPAKCFMCRKPIKKVTIALAGIYDKELKAKGTGTEASPIEFTESD